MIGRKSLFYRLGCVLLGIAALAIVTVVIVQPNEVRSSSRSLYQMLQSAAGQGNEWAKEKLAEVDARQAREGHTSPPDEREVAARQTINGTTITLKGREPFFLKIDNLPEFNTVDSISTYVASRKASLVQLAASNRERQIEVSISPQSHMPVTELWALKATHNMDIDEMIVDLFVEGKWHSTMFVGDPKDPGEKPYIDFTQSAGQVEAQIRRLVPPQPAPAPGNGANTNATPASSEFEPRVAWARGKIRAADALALDANPSIMLVDPITDLLDPYKDRATEVRVNNVPHVLIEKSRLQGLVYPVQQP